jgi:hypothetical protein
MRAIKASQAPQAAKALELFAQSRHLDYYDLREVSVRGRIAGREVEIGLRDGYAPGYLSDTLQFFLGFLRGWLIHLLVKAEMATGPSLDVVILIKGQLPTGLRLIREDYSSGVDRISRGDRSKTPELHIEVEEPDENGDGVLAFLNETRRDALSKLLADGTAQMRGAKVHYACRAPETAEAVAKKVDELIALVAVLDPGPQGSPSTR